MDVAEKIRILKEEYQRNDQVVRSLDVAQQAFKVATA